MTSPSVVDLKRWTSCSILLVLFSVIWICLLDFPVRLAGVSLDDSWQKSFGYFLKKGMQAGTEFVFTYGPLGYFNSPIYDPDLYWAAFAWELITKSLLVYYLFRIFQRPCSLTIKVLFLILVFLFLPIVHRDVEYLIFITVVGLNITDKDSSRVAQTVGLVTLSVVSLGKFILFLLGSVIAFFCEIRHRTVRPGTLFSPTLIFLLAYCVAWIFAGQSLSNLPTYIFSSLQIAFGYNESMAITGDPNETLLSVFLLILILTILALIARHEKGRVQIFVLLTGLLLAWKQGFTRQDNHTVIFFGYALVSVFLLVVYFGYGSRQHRHGYSAAHRMFAVGAVSICILGSAIGIFHSPWSGSIFHQKALRMLLATSWWTINNNLRILASPVAKKVSLQQQEDELEKHSRLALISSQVGDSTVDIMSCQQGFLLLNRMNWRPRPVFQSYSAYTAYLAKRNADFFRSPSAPEYLLFKSQPLDNRLPATEDGLALSEILGRYEPQATEQSFLLMKKNSELQAGSLRPVMQAGSLRSEVITFDQKITVNTRFRYQQLRLDIKDTIPGKIRKLFYKQKYIFIKLKTKSGITYRYRLLPALARNGFLLTPLLLRTGDVVHYYQSTGGLELESFMIETDSPGVWFQNEIDMEIRSLSPPHPSSFSANQFALLRDSVNSGLAYQMKDSDAGTTITPLDISERASPAYDHLALFGEGLVEADPVVLPAGKYKIVLVGYGTKAAREFPKVEFYMDRKIIGTLSVNEQDQYELPFQITNEKKVIFGISFINDDVIGKEDRNVFIQRIYVENLLNPISGVE